jgi:hypothetical protein
MFHLPDEGELRPMALELDGGTHLPAWVSTTHIATTSSRTPRESRRPDLIDFALSRRGEIEPLAPREQFVGTQHMVTSTNRGDYAADLLWAPQFIMNTAVLWASHRERQLCSSLGLRIDEEGVFRPLKQVVAYPNDRCPMPINTLPPGSVDSTKVQIRKSHWLA